jgi:hypothetical protein
MSKTTHSLPWFCSRWSDSSSRGQLWSRQPPLKKMFQVVETGFGLHTHVMETWHSDNRINLSDRISSFESYVLRHTVLVKTVRCCCENIVHIIHNVCTYCCFLLLVVKCNRRNVSPIERLPIANIMHIARNMTVTHK